ncbi:MAG TPA: carboxypeptidase-like regulatory domain-containing protein [Planctomycetota bacterium]|nr:carboxypeptidase-like regulatory domain-containing protein [Planctomycetota bacterium]
MLGALTLVLCLPPQGEPAVVGRVLDEAGKPVARASVTLLHRPIARDPDATREHRVAVSTDARGKFRAPLRADAIYSVWAANANAASCVAEGVDAGSFVELRLAGGTAPVVVNVPDLYTWADGATFRYRTVVGSEHVDFVDLAVANGRLTVPPLPPLCPRTIEVLRGDGEVLWADTFETRPRGSVLSIPPPTEIEITVRDAAGAALPGATVRRHVRTYATTASDAVFVGDRKHAPWANVGQSGADGKLVFRTTMPPSAKPNLWLLTSKDGHAMSIDGLCAGKLVAAGVELPADQQSRARDRFPVTLHPGKPQALSLRQANGTAWATDSLFVLARIQITAGDRNPSELFPISLPIADGVATLPDPLPPGSGFTSAWTTLAGPARDELRQRLGTAPPATFRVPRPWLLRSAAPQPPFEPEGWYSLQLIMADGRPAAQTTVLVHGESHGNSERQLLRTDRIGRVAFERHGYTRVTVFAVCGCASMQIGPRDEGPTQLVLQAMFRVTGALTNADGSPARGASVLMQLACGAGCNQPQSHEAVANLLPIAPSGDDGSFELLLPPFCARLDLRVTARDGTQAAMATVEWDPKRPRPIAIALARQ